ncbi:hypothetical protein CH253_26685 [Rhodococcus sp. 06-156-3C]|uniref:hypothetical protein n=1 Tax=Nocardiaceae TaxID=85025 RepID=UPI000522F39A|nr:MULTISPECIES: hypothetical protein [Rhodococcus]OZD12271.1 hypothetical protein CH253_26685 [Rhodococcus sp. 06-156-3C]OZD19063.1 hypothetical protein CH280_05165 [Rhodococcus sp. 06-156-4C]OZD20897.1 hypothetical protein CH248_11560 [Rhodococcus sp. 06-156-4a]OZD29072.1 hypothetical protein CH247_19155 [Rhodococcus sp. 06-156-3b]OZD33629.1 hypothetical protein CH284_18625 [Rhodococcus sp. 06-156-3]
MDERARPLGYTVTFTEPSGAHLGRYHLQAIDGHHVVIITPHAHKVETEIRLLEEHESWELRREAHVATRDGGTLVEVNGVSTPVYGDSVVRSVADSGSIVLTRFGADEPEPLGAWTKSPVRPEPIVEVE